MQGIVTILLVSLIMWVLVITGAWAVLNFVFDSPVQLWR